MVRVNELVPRDAVQLLLGALEVMLAAVARAGNAERTDGRKDGQVLQVN